MGMKSRDAVFFRWVSAGRGRPSQARWPKPGVKRLVIHDINTARRDQVIKNVGAAYPELAVEVGTLADGPFDIVINATPLGMREEDPLPFDPTNLPHIDACR